MDNILIVANAYDTLAEMPDFCFDLEGDEVQYIRMFAERITGERVIDLGCGRGRIARFIHEKVGSNIIGCDISNEMIKIANSINLYPTHITFSVCDMQTISADVLFDAAIISFSLIHLTHIQAIATLSNLHNLLKYDAQVYISVLMGEGGGYRNDPLNDKITTFVNLYTEEEMRMLLSSCGYIITDLMIGEDNDPAAFAKEALYIIAQKH